MSDDTLGSLLKSANVRSISIESLADEERSLALDLAAHATLRARSAGADAVAIVAGVSRDLTCERLDLVTEGDPPLVIVIDPHNRRRGDVEYWVSAHDGWLMMKPSPIGTEVVAPIKTLTVQTDLDGVWRGGADRASEPAVPGAPAITTRSPRQRPEPDATVREELIQLQSASDSQRVELDRVRAQLLDDRTWVASEAERVRASSSWRIGHRLARIARLVTFRRDKGSDALTRLVERMRAPVGR